MASHGQAQHIKVWTCRAHACRHQNFGFRSECWRCGGKAPQHILNQQRRQPKAGQVRAPQGEWSRGPPRTSVHNPRTAQQQPVQEWPDEDKFINDQLLALLEKRGVAKESR
eukprot:4738332-Pyramimonas_sp.AAC.1